MIPLRVLFVVLAVMAAPVAALPDPSPPSPALVRPVARPFDLYLTVLAATLACLDSQSGRRRC